DEAVLQAASGAHRVQRPGRADLPGGHDGDMVAQTLDQLHDVAGKDDGAAVVDEGAQDAPDGHAGDWVDGLERLVEHEHGRRVDEGGGQRDLLRHPGGVVDDEDVGRVGEVERGEQGGTPLGDDRRVHAAQHTRVVDELGAGEPVEELHPVGQDAELAFA